MQPIFVLKKCVVANKNRRDFCFEIFVEEKKKNFCPFAGNRNGFCGDFTGTLLMQNIFGFIKEFFPSSYRRKLFSLC